MKKAKLSVHPDVVVGEPIPEVEPRVNLAVLEVTRGLVRLGYVWLSIWIVILGVFFVVRPGLAVSIGIMMVVLLPWMAVVIRHRKVLKELKKDEWCLPFGDTVRYRLVSGGVGLSLYMPVVVSFGLTALTMVIGAWICMLGVALVVLPLRAREPGQICCVKCFYALVGLSLPCPCPECGQIVFDGAGTTDRVRVHLPGVVMTGCVVGVVGLSIAVASFMRPGMLYGVMPSRAIQALAVTDRDAFERYTQGPMSAAQTNELIEALIERSGRLEYLQRRWLGELMEAGGLSDDQVALYMEGVPAIRIDGPGEMTVGDEVEISLASMRNTRNMVYYFFEGFRVGDEMELYSGSDHFRSWRYLYKDLFRSESFAEDSSNRPFYILKAEAAGGVGEIVVRGRVVVVLTDVQNMMTFEWGEDGEWMFEKEPVWVRVVDLEHTILVVE